MIPCRVKYAMDKIIIAWSIWFLKNSKDFLKKEQITPAVAIIIYLYILF